MSGSNLISRRRFLAGLASVVSGSILPRGLGQVSRGTRFGVGFVLPSTDVISTASRLYSARPAGESARQGAIYADEVLFAKFSALGLDLQTHLAVAAESESAMRASLRMIAAEHVDVIVGGFGRDIAFSLAEVASSTGVPFINVGSSSQELRAAFEGSPVAHIAPSDQMYMTAIAQWSHKVMGHSTWSIVYPDNPGGNERLAEAVDAARHLGIQVTDSIAVEFTQPNYGRAAQAVAAARSDATILLVGWHGQLDFLAQAEAWQVESDILAWPDSPSQTRHFYGSAQLVAPRLGTGYRFSPWEASAPFEPAATLSLDFARRWATTLDGPGWLTYQAIDSIASSLATRVNHPKSTNSAGWLANEAASLPTASSLTGGHWSMGQAYQEILVAKIRNTLQTGHSYEHLLHWADYVGLVGIDGEVLDATS